MFNYTQKKKGRPPGVKNKPGSKAGGPRTKGVRVADMPTQNAKRSRQVAIDGAHERSRSADPRLEGGSAAKRQKTMHNDVPERENPAEVPMLMVE